MDENEKEDTRDVKIILLGENGVGKTSIINRYINNKFNPDIQNETLGSNYLTKDIKNNNINYRLKIWDTNGQEKFHSVTKLFIQGSNIILLVYSIDSKESFENLDFWYNTMKSCLNGKNYIFAIIANKSDLEENEAVSEEEGKSYAEEKEAMFQKISAKEDGDGINKLFDNLIDELRKTNYQVNASIVLTKTHFKKKKKDQKKKNC